MVSLQNRFFSTFLLLCCLVNHGYANDDECYPYALRNGITIISANSTYVRYYQFSVPPINPWVAGSSLKISLSCTFTVYYGYDNITCPNAILNNGTYITGNMTFTPDEASVVQFGVIATDGSNCMGGISLSALCGDCPHGSVCGQEGCTCMSGLYGWGCNVTGACDPFGKPTACAIDGGKGYGYFECVYTDANHNVTKFGECVLAQCAPQYIPQNNHCVQPSCSSTNLTWGSIYDVALVSGNYSYFSIPLPSTSSLLLSGVKVDINAVSNAACNETIQFSALVGNTACPNPTSNSGSYPLVSTLSLEANSSNTSPFLYISVISYGQCETGIVVRVTGICTATCPARSVCGAAGCTCYTNWYGDSCEVTGECNPFATPQACTVENGVGHYTCEFTDNTNTTTINGACVATACNSGYTISKHKCKEESKLADFTPLQLGGILVGAIVFGVLVSALIFTCVARLRRHTYEPVR